MDIKSRIKTLILISVLLSNLGLSLAENDNSNIVITSDTGKCLETTDGTPLFVFLPHVYTNIPQKDKIDEWTHIENILLQPWQPLIIKDKKTIKDWEFGNYQLQTGLGWSNSQQVLRLVNRLNSDYSQVLYGSQELKSKFMWGLYFFDENGNNIPDDPYSLQLKNNLEIKSKGKTLFACAPVPENYYLLPEPFLSRSSHLRDNGNGGTAYEGGP